MKKEKKVVLMFLTAVNVFTAQAQDKDSSKLLQEVIVSASRFEEDPSATTRSVTVIGSDEIAKMAYRNVGELLTAQEGIYVVGANQNPGMVQTIFMRGTNSNQTIILIDGVRITDPSSVNNAVDLSEISLANVERIEIVRGSHSTLFGSSAIGGVINIITKKGKQQGLSGSVLAEGGLFAPEGKSLNAQIFLNYRDTSSGFYANASAYRMNSTGIDATLDTITTAGVFKNRDRDGFVKTDVSARIGIDKKKFSAWTSLRLHDQQSDIDRGAFSDDENYTLDFKRKAISAGIDYKFNEKMRLSYLGGLSMMERYAVNDSSVIDALGNTDQTYSDSRNTGGLMSHDLQLTYLSDKIRFIAGASFYQETMNQESYYINTAWMYESKSNLDSLDLHINTISAFSQLRLNGTLLHEKAKNFDLTLGGRYINNSSFGTAFTGEINPSLKIGEKDLLYLSYSTGFNAPSLYQLYAPDDFYGYGITLGNTGLNAEISRSFEAGLKHRISNTSLMTVSWFSNRTENMIDYVNLWNKNSSIDSLGWMDGVGATYVNVGTLYSNGVEISLRSELSEKVYIIANASLVQGKIVLLSNGIDTAQTKGHHVQLYSSGAFITGETEQLGLSRRPTTARITLGWKPVKGLDLSTTLRMAGARSDLYYDYSIYPSGGLSTLLVKDYTLLDMNASWKHSSGIGATLRIENIFDTQYAEINGFRTRGRGVYFGVRYVF